ncbi:hypothetical protein JOB18_026696 [Solea senegalensis]|uniref:Uncharacterized protein n=1 Tax=Solea senegalensis TaxID=28829 RepID=A0AAV6SJI1_SOLSE|nr:hypothetical protein JOB18_026696 [Solea senegalensis]
MHQDGALRRKELKLTQGICTSELHHGGAQEAAAFLLHSGSPKTILDGSPCHFTECH